MMGPISLRAQTNAVTEARKAVVLVVCADRQGTGSVINGAEGYVLTNGHVALDADTGVLADDCEIAFANDEGRPTSFYHASIVRAVFNNQLNQDFAILKIGTPSGPVSVRPPFPSLQTNEFTKRGDVIYVLGYSAPRDFLSIREGHILDYESGFIKVDVVIAPGDSGGAALDPIGFLFGVPTRIVTLTSETGTETTDYELVDVRAVMNWLDTYGPFEHDKFFTHENYAVYHQNAAFVSQENLGCVAVGRAPTISSVYCLNADGTRFAFPTDNTYFSWFSDFTNVEIFSLDTISSYRLTRNVTFKPGTLVKVATSPHVFVVVDAFGTLRWIPSEQKAVELWGPAWAGLVRDVPDEFWTNYKIGQPLE